MLYQIDGTVVEETTTGEGISTQITHQIPTFYLNSDVQGIVDVHHAAKIAEEIVNPAKLDTLTPHINATTVFEVTPG